MSEFVKVSAQCLHDAVYEACFKANVMLPVDVLNLIEKIETENSKKSLKYKKIISNVQIAGKKLRPLCQDTGQVVVFVEIGNRVFIEDGILSEVINKAVSDCYCEKFFRKSIVKNALFNRENTKTNVPVILYTDVVDGREIKIDILIKGGGAENMSLVKMFNPSSTEEDVEQFVLEVVEKAGENACPPLFLGVGIGGTVDFASVLSKKAFFKKENLDFAKKLKENLNKKSNVKIADVSVLSAQTHIACLPVCVTVNCHCARHVSLSIDNNGYKLLTNFVEDCSEEFVEENILEVQTSDIETIQNLEEGQEILLTGTLYTARDMAHKRLVELIDAKKELPFELKNSIIFYAGPCPKKENEIIGPIGPTTSKRMDKFAPVLYDSGLLATIGKGNRSSLVVESIKDNSAIYFTSQGGVASLLQNCVKKAEVIAFEDLGAEAIYKLEVEKFPVKVDIK